MAKETIEFEFKCQVGDLVRPIGVRRMGWEAREWVSRVVARSIEQEVLGVWTEVLYLRGIASDGSVTTTLVKMLAGEVELVKDLEPDSQ